jgi:chromosome segregation ATPase
MNEQRIPTVTRLEPQDEPAGDAETPSEPQPKRLLGELSRASESLAEVLDGLTAEKRELEARLERRERELEERLERTERELERARAEAATAKSAAATAFERAKDESAGQIATTARAAARNQARAERAERLLAVVGALRETATFSVTVGRRARKQASREMLAQAVTDGVQLRLSAHPGWWDSLLVAEAEGDPTALQRYLTWARSRFAEDDLRERQD